MQIIKVDMANHQYKKESVYYVAFHIDLTALIFYLSEKTVVKKL